MFHWIDSLWKPGSTPGRGPNGLLLLLDYLARRVRAFFCPPRYEFMAVTIDKEWNESNGLGYFILTDSLTGSTQQFGPYAYSGTDLHTIAQRHASRFQEWEIENEARRLKDEYAKKDEDVPAGTGATSNDVKFLIFRELINSSTELDIPAIDLFGLTQQWGRSNNTERTLLTGLTGARLKDFNDAVRAVKIALRELKALKIERGLADGFKPPKVGGS